MRPSHTYDHTAPPFDGGWTVVDRMRRGAEVVVHGDGTSLWTLTHHTDFARAFVGLLGHPAAIGDSFHITSDEWLSWNQIYEIVAAAAGVTPRLVHVTSDAIAAVDADWGAALLGDKAHSMVFDNAKVKQLVPGWRPRCPSSAGPPRSSTGSTPTRPASRSTPGWTPSWTGSSSATGRPTRR